MSTDAWTVTDDSGNIFVTRMADGTALLTVATQNGAQSATLSAEDQDRLRRSMENA